MLQHANVSASLALAKGATVTFSDRVEASLDCCVCRRCMRTVLFEAGRADGLCTPTGHAFPGRIAHMQAGPRSVLYRLEYQFQPFEDAKYPGIRMPQPYPEWARVSFAVCCPRCGASTPLSVQTNEVRPWTARCSCGEALYTTRQVMPRLSPRARLRPSRWLRLRRLLGFAPKTSPQ
jgi:hypothetical protein